LEPTAESPVVEFCQGRFEVEEGQLNIINAARETQD
jgi:hypothetical protein